MNFTDCRSLLLVCLLLPAACKTSSPPPPARVGDWRIAGASNALLASRDGGDFGDTDVFRGGVSAGRMISETLMLEGVATFEDSKAEDSAGNDTNLRTFSVGGGVRYYFDTQSASRPYIGVQGGIAAVDVDDDLTTIDDSDTAPFARAGIGLESFLNEHAALDIGLVYERIFNVELNSVEDDMSTVAGMIGLSVWL